jgi:hypothetical protein
MISRRRPAVASLAVVLVSCLTLGVATTAVSASVGAAKAPVCKGKTKKKAIKAVEETWNQVLDGTLGLTLDEKFAGIENSDDPEFRAVLDDIAAKNAGLLNTVTLDMKSTTCKGKKEAEVIYDLVISGVPSPGIAGPGKAVLIGKEWKMSQTTVCDLFALSDPLLVESGPCAEIALEG